MNRADRIKKIEARKDFPITSPKNFRNLPSDKNISLLPEHGMYELASKKIILIFIILILVVSAALSQNKNGNASNDDQYKLSFEKANKHLAKYEFEESIKSCETALEYKPNDFLVRAIMCLNYFEIAEKLE